MTEESADTGDPKPTELRCPFCLKMNRLDMSRAADRPKCGSCGKPFLLDRPFKVAGDDLDYVVQHAGIPVMVDFYADWCGPCRMMAPTLDEFAAGHVGEVLVAKVDTDASPAISQKYGIQGIPTMIFFRDGTEAARQVGVSTQETLKDMLRE